MVRVLLTSLISPYARGAVGEGLKRRGAGSWRGIDRAVERAKCEKIKGSSLTNSSKGKYCDDATARRWSILAGPPAPQSASQNFSPLSLPWNFFLALCQIGPSIYLFKKSCI
ncbi:hypothetical protein BJX65DRAFT_188347 [Aspergillus insuetus]